jgi:diguanylate cyclase (GGDEF)-like protein
MSTSSVSLPTWRARAPGLRPSWLSWTIAFGAGLAATVVGVEFWQISNVREATLRNAAASTMSLAQAIALQVDNTFKTADTVVAAICERIEVEGTAPAAQDRLYGLMTSLAKALPAIHEMGIQDRKGDAIVKSRMRSPTGINYSDREYFRYLSTHPTRDPYFGQPVRSKVDGSFNVTVSRRLEVGGTFDGVVVASVSMNFFRRMFESVDSPAVIALVADDGTVVAANRAGYRDGDLAAMVRAGSALEYDAGEGNRRVGSFRALPYYPMTVFVAQESSEVLAGWRAQTRNHAVLVGAGLVALAVLGWRLECATRQTRRQAMFDTLTGLPNRRLFNDAIDGEFRRAARKGERLSFAMADIDLFKDFNDTYGHQAGDDCLKAVADAVAGVLGRGGDLAARYGGEEIAILMPDTDLAGAALMAEKMQAAVSELRIPHGSSPYGIVTISTGVASCIPNPVTSWTALVRAADDALYVAKASGRNTVRMQSGGDLPSGSGSRPGT